MTNLIEASCQSVTMSSREIAELCNKDHKNVIRDIRAMLAGLRTEPSDFEGEYKDSTGRALPCFNLPKRKTLILISGYNVELRARIIDRWQELESQQASTFVMPDLNDPVLLAQLLLEHTGKRIEAEKRADVAEQAVAAVKPKAKFFDQFLSAEGLYGLQNAARILNERPNKFIGWLKQDYLFYQGSCLVPRVAYRQQGIFEVKATMIEDKARYQTYITPKGLRYFAEKLQKTGELFGYGA
ncbi:phage regulatory protein/antirepressor Ant [Agrobacterium vitis]|uniref:phage regulatory protein/antirepressor Ant n=1 Tax=Agrobacterium vitis TaxID=373 RepID=UPI0012E8ED79|nr:phage regulatory protein/antirepressor Ant [Agrobacterium vitis]MUZ63516.1 phage regulatory protein/antirepressor Ant [Agrobacterium vitis]